MGEALKDEKRQIEKNKRRKAQTKVSKIDMTMNRMETMCDLCENDLSREKKSKASWKQQARDWRRTPARRDNTESLCRVTFIRVLQKNTRNNSPEDKIVEK